LKFEGKIEDLILQEEEVAELKFISVEEVEKDLEKNPDKFIPHGDYWQEIFEEVRKKV